MVEVLPDFELPENIRLSLSITITSEKVEKINETKVNVKNEITLDKSDISLNIGESENLIAIIESEDTNITWSSDDETIAIVSNGTVTAISQGETTISAKVNNTIAVCKITVTAKEVKNEKQEDENSS